MGIVTVVGIGADGWAGLDAAGQTRVLEADVVVGGARHLEMVPEAPQRREPWPSPLRVQLAAFMERLNRHEKVVVLASGDPLVSGIGTTLIEVLGPDAVEIIPAISSVALARARMKWPAETVDVISLVGRDPHTVLGGLAPGRRLLVLSGDGSTPDTVARLLVDAGWGASALTVLEELGARTERVSSATAATWRGPVGPLNIIAIECAGALGLGLGPGLPDESFDHDGQITKRDIRASALARLAPQPGQLLWDVGSGAGSVAIEWMRAHPTCHSIAIEAREDRAKRSSGNATKLGVPAMRIVNGRAPAALEGLDAPHAIFVGGGATEPGVLEACWAALPAGGRLVVHGVTLETEAVLAGWYGEHGGQLTRLRVEHADPIGGFTGWKPARAITQWAATR